MVSMIDQSKCMKWMEILWALVVGPIDVFSGYAGCHFPIQGPITARNTIQYYGADVWCMNLFNLLQSCHTKTIQYCVYYAIEINQDHIVQWQTLQQCCEILHTFGDVNDDNNTGDLLFHASCITFVTQLSDCSKRVENWKCFGRN